MRLPDLGGRDQLAIVLLTLDPTSSMRTSGELGFAKEVGVAARQPAQDPVYFS
jgi:hypothetical protein